MTQPQTTFVPLLPSTRGALRHVSRDTPALLCPVLHGHGMEAREMVEWFEPLFETWPSVYFLFLQAPCRWHGASGQFLPGWFDYVAEHEGAQEDEISAESLQGSLQALEDVVRAEAASLGISRVACLGLSEGGCMALELARRLPLHGVVTLVSHRRSEHASEPLTCPWLALTAKKDSVYAAPWALAHLPQASRWVVVDDEHYLEESDEAVKEFLHESLRTLSETSKQEAP